MNRRLFLSSLGLGLAAAALPAVVGSSPTHPTNRQLIDDLKTALERGSMPIAGKPLNIHPMSLEGLSERALAVASSPRKCLSIEINYPSTQGHDPLPGDDDCYYSHGKCIQHHPRRHLIDCQYFSKVAPLVDGQLPEEYHRATVQAFGNLVDAGILDYGVLAPPSWVPLATGWRNLTKEPTTPEDEFIPPRALCFFFAYPKVEWVQGLRLSEKSADPPQCWQCHRQAEAYVVRRLPDMSTFMDLELGCPDHLDGTKSQTIRDSLSCVLGNTAFVLQGQTKSEDWLELLCKGHPDINVPHCPELLLGIYERLQGVLP